VRTKKAAPFQGAAFFVLGVAQNHSLPERRQPIHAVADAPTHDVLELLLDVLSERPNSTVADDTAVDRTHRRDFGACPAQEDLLGDVELRTRDRTLDEAQAEVFGRQSDQRAARDAVEVVLGRRW